MATFLRDKELANITVTEELIRQLITVIVSRQENYRPQSDNDTPILYYVIRFDEKGYKVFDQDGLLQHFNNAEKIERLIITLETPESIATNRNVGTCVEIRLDSKNQCFLVTTSNDNDWMDSTFTALQEILNKFKNKNGIARSSIFDLVVQIVGISTGFILSLWATIKISPSLTIENAFIICFLFILLIFSNIWGHINNVLLSYIHSLFPKIQFRREGKDKVNWIMQSLVAGVAIATTLWAIGKVLTFLSDFIKMIAPNL